MSPFRVNRAGHDSDRDQHCWLTCSRLLSRARLLPTMFAVNVRRPLRSGLLLFRAGCLLVCLLSAQPTRAEELPAEAPAAPSVKPIITPLESIMEPREEIRVPAPMRPVEVPPTEPAPEPFAAPQWSVPTLRPREFDWLRLTNGEWLKGEVDDLRRDRLYFDSDEFDELNIDWEKIHSLRTAGLYTFGFTGRRQATGRALITPTQVIVLTEEGEELVFDREDLYSIVHAQTGFWSLWQGKIGVGATVRSGNTNQIDLDLSSVIKRQTAFTRFTWDTRANFGELEGTTTIRNIRNNFSFDFFVTDRLFITPAEIEVYRDELQNIDRRISPGGGLGYELVDSKWLTFNIQAGGVFRSTKSITVETGEDEVNRTGAVTAGSNFESTLTPRIDLDGGYDVSVGIPDVSDTNHHAEIILSVDITKVIELDISFLWDHIGEPITTDQSETPNKDDFQLVAGIAINF
jgi:putative salt-induced outer membrane protein YdiY